MWVDGWISTQEAGPAEALALSTPWPHAALHSTAKDPSRPPGKCHPLHPPWPVTHTDPCFPHPSQRHTHTPVHPAQQPSHPLLPCVPSSSSASPWAGTLLPSAMSPLHLETGAAWNRLSITHCPMSKPNPLSQTPCKGSANSGQTPRVSVRLSELLTRGGSSWDSTFLSSH